MTTATSEAAASRTSPTSLFAQLALICGMVFVEFLAMGLPLPVLPGHVHATLGFGSFVVGVVIGAQSWITLATRHFAGTRSDARGPRSAVVAGLGVSIFAGVLHALSSLVGAAPASLLVLVAGRGLLGIGESLVVTGALAWGVGLAGRERSGIVMAWVGIAMYAALALGAPLGSALDSRFGFVGMALAAAAAPLAGTLFVPFVAPVAAAAGTRLPFHRVLKLIWLPGAGLALSAVGFGAIAAFSALLFRTRGWSHAPLVMTAFGAAYVLARLLFGKLPDRFGGARVAVASAAVATIGQVAMWLATTPFAAVAAAGLTGLGFSLAFPSFGVEAVRRVPPQNRGVALGAYAACFDAAMGLGVPVLGGIVGSFGHSAAFAAGAASSMLALVIALVLLIPPRAPRA